LIPNDATPFPRKENPEFRADKARDKYAERELKRAKIGTKN